MPHRNLRIVHFNFPLTAICESCNQTFKSEAHLAQSAEHEIRTAFDAHACRLDGSQNAPGIMREAAQNE